MNRIALFCLALIATLSLSAQDFDKFFEEGSLRVDYFHGGNSTEEFISNDALYHEPFLEVQK